MKISIIAWDANFRESLHTLNFFADQDLDQAQYEFLWIDFYSSNNRVRESIAQHPNCRLITLDQPTHVAWHLGQCINTGAEEAKGELLIIPDGDIAVERDFLSRVLESHAEQAQLVTYHRRYDEPKEFSSDKSRTSIDYLKTHTRLTNPTNYAGCLALRKDLLLQVNCYETHSVFAGPGINGMDTYLRLRNAGFKIKWEPNIKIYHPWHPSSGNSGHDLIKVLNIAKNKYPWIIPYAGIEQSWIIHQREKNLSMLACEAECEKLIEEMPSLGEFEKKIVINRKYSIMKLFRLLHSLPRISK